MTSNVQDGGHDVISRPPVVRCIMHAAAAATSAGCPLTSRARVTPVPDPQYIRTIVI